ncbi:unnamed protein product [Calypogeia fissa]
MTRYALSDCVRRDMPISGLPLIPRAEKGDIVIPQYTGCEEPKAAVRFLTLWSLWAIQMGFSHGLTKQLLQEYIKKAFNLPSVDKVCKTWKDYVDYYYQRHHIPPRGGGLPSAGEFVRWYDDCAKNITVVWFSYGELELATEGFSDRNRVGQGSMGVVYEARLPGRSDRLVVKARKVRKNENLDKVLDEVCLRREITKLTHPDIVHLIGFCSNARNPLLVLEFIGGNLRHHIEGVYGDQLQNNPRIRLSIAIDVANALVQLHYKGRWPIFHRDVRSTNILIDSEWRAKLNDLGLAVGIKSESDKRISPLPDLQGYVDPVYKHTEILHDKNDVYSYGVVLMELVTLMKVWDSTRAQRCLVDLVISRTSGAHPYSVIGSGNAIPPGKEEEIYGAGILERMLHVAVWCCDFDLERRPSIAEVADYLQNFRESGSRRRWTVDSNFVGDQRGRLGWNWEHPSPIISPRDPD